MALPVAAAAKGAHFAYKHRREIAAGVALARDAYGRFKARRKKGKKRPKKR